MEFEEKINRIKELINESEAIIIGAGAGLSTAAGFIYDGEVFLENFKYMNDKYGYNDMYSACFHNFKTSEEKWGYWSKFIYLNRYQGAKKLYLDLYELFKDKNYFILTTNVDHQFQLAGFDKKRLFYTQGDYGLFQCSVPCHNKTYDNEEMIKEMINNQIDHKILSNLVPRCPICGREMVPNLRSDENFVEDEGWQEAASRYVTFRSKYKKVLLLELGVGYNTPSIIKYPFWKMTNENKDATYVIINKGDAYVPEMIMDKSISIQGDFKDIIERLL